MSRWVEYHGLRLSRSLAFGIGLAALALAAGLETPALAAGASRRWGDVLGTLFSVETGWGALHVTSASAGIVAAGQTTTPAAVGGTYGQSVPALAPSEWIPRGFARWVATAFHGSSGHG